MSSPAKDVTETTFTEDISGAYKSTKKFLIGDKKKQEAAPPLP